MSKVSTVSYKCSMGRDGFFSESLEIALDTTDNADFLSADALAQMNTVADALRKAAQDKMHEWKNAAGSPPPDKPMPAPTKRGTITDKQLSKLKGFTNPWAVNIKNGFCQDENVSGVEELSYEAAQVLIDELFARAKAFKERRMNDVQIARSRPLN